jgi:thiopeptide-type bacteriocin biosynthesis protein
MTEPLNVQRRTFPPGSEWLYAKLYTGSATADRVLRDAIAPLVEEVTGTGAVDRWFFIRYGDPDWHLRLRFHGEPQRLQAEVLPALQELAADLMEEGRIRRFQLDTYEQEVERYGGPAAMGLAEQLFHADSAAVLEIVELIERGDAGLDERWRLCLRGMDMLLAELGFDLEGRAGVLKSCREGFAREFRVEKGLKAQLGERFRKERASLAALLDPANDAESRLGPGLEALARRSEALRPVAAALRALEQVGRLTCPLADVAASALHMHANRLLRSAARAQELVLYDLLARLYQARLAAGRPARSSAAAEETTI